MEQSLRAERRWGAKTAIERKTDRRKSIIRAAIEIYGETGYRTATVKAVCAAAGLTERYFYESFANSEDLLRHCFLDVTSKLLAKLRQAAEEHHGSPLDRVRAALLVYFGQLKAHPAGARVFLVEMATVSAATEALVSASLDEFGSVLMQVMRVDEGSQIGFSPLLLRGVVGGGSHIAQAWIASGYAECIEHVVDAAMRLYALMAVG